MNANKGPGIAEEIQKALDEYLAVKGNPAEGSERLMQQFGIVKEFHDNSPTWLRSLLEENEKLRKERDAKLAFISKGNDEDMYWLQEENIRLSSELAAKDKVLEWYGDEMPHAGSITSKALIDKGIKARSILSQYAKEGEKSEI